MTYELTPEQTEQAQAVLDALMDEDAIFALFTVALNAFEQGARAAGYDKLNDPDVVLEVMVSMGGAANGFPTGRRVAAYRELAATVGHGADHFEAQPPPMTAEEVDTLWAEHTQGAKPGEGVAGPSEVKP